MDSINFKLYILYMKKITTLGFTIFTSIFLMTGVALAQVTGADASAGIQSLGTLIDSFTSNVVKSLAILLLSLALLAFFWGVIQFIWGLREGKEDEIKKGKVTMTWGIIALFVMFSVYGIIKLGQSIAFGGKDVTTITIPNIDFKAKAPTSNTTNGLNSNTNSKTNSCTTSGGGYGIQVGGVCVPMGGGNGTDVNCTSDQTYDAAAHKCVSTADLYVD